MGGGGPQSEVISFFRLLGEDIQEDIFFNEMWEEMDIDGNGTLDFQVVHAQARTHAFKHMHMCIYVSTHSLFHVSTCFVLRAHIYTHIHMYVGTHMHTKTPTLTHALL